MKDSTPKPGSGAAASGGRPDGKSPPDHSARAIRRFCLDCQGGHPPAVRDCRDLLCCFYPLRLIPISAKPAPAQPAKNPPGRAAGGISGQTPDNASAMTPGAQPRDGGVGARQCELFAAPAKTTPPAKAAAKPDLATPAADQPGRPLERPCRLIRRFCLICAGSRAEVRFCAEKNCALWSFRFGVLPETFRRVAARRREKRQTLLLPGLGLS